MLEYIGLKRNLIFLVFCTGVLYGQPRIQLKSTEIDFGTVVQNKTQKKVLLFKNIGNEDLEVEIFKSSCGCSKGELIVKDKLVAPRETGEIIINFKSRDFIGSMLKSLYVHTNDPENRKVEIKVKANVIPSFVVVYYFYSENCEECLYVENNVLDKFKNKYNLRIRNFDVKDSSNYEYFLYLLGKYGRKNSEMPVVFVGKDMLKGVFEIENFLEDGIIETLKSKGIVNTSADSENTFFNFFKTLKGAQIVFFFDKKCGSCGRVEKEISFLEKNKFKVVRYDIEKKERKQLNEAFCEAYNVPRDKRLTTPMVFVGEHYLTYEDLQKTPLREYVFTHREDIGVIPLIEVLSLSEGASAVIKERFEKMGVFAILSAGLLDGVNPCAFATILFLVAFLSAIGKNKREILLVGITYSTVVFVVYFLIGIGLIRAIGALAFTVIIGKCILVLVAVFSVFLSVMSFFDYLKIKQGKTSEIKLQLPRFIKKNIHSLVREKMKMKNLFAAAVVSGFFISFSEFVCTGQIYLPTLMFVSEVPSLRIKAILYLFVYNIAFIIPLGIVFVSAYRGMSSSALNRFWRSKVEVVKLISALFFFFLAGLLIFYAFFI
jgi:glutaredoxin